MKKQKVDVYDLLIIGGGINGSSIARDASGRNLKVALVEMNDIGWATSSNSSKLLHGGLRYLEYMKFRLVREALQEREILFNIAPHIAWRLRIILPYKRILTRPKIAMRFAFYLYDHLAKLINLQKSKGINLKKHIAGLDLDLKHHSKKGYEYSDLGTLDTKFCILNCVDAESRGAHIFTRTKVTKATRKNGIWEIEIQSKNKTSILKAKTLVNTTGPWTNEVIEKILPINDCGRVHLVQGSHIIVPKMFEHQYGYFLETNTKRLIFVLPYENDYTMIGTTDVEFSGDPAKVKCTEKEKKYLLDITNKWFKVQLKPEDIIWDFSGVRALYADGKNATSATRDYVIKIDTQEDGKAPVLNLFGGKITAAREIGEKIMNMLAPIMKIEKSQWTRTTPLYGGDFQGLTFEQYVVNARIKYRFAPDLLIRRLVRHYGTHIHTIMDNAKNLKDLGKHFGAQLYEKEVKYMIDVEYAQTAEDIVWRRTRLGLHMTNAEIKALDAYMSKIIKS